MTDEEVGIKLTVKSVNFLGVNNKKIFINNSLYNSFIRI